jgi:hypothetical protein
LLLVQLFAVAPDLLQVLIEAGVIFGVTSEPAPGGLGRHSNQISGGKPLVEQLAHPAYGFLTRVRGGVEFRKADGFGGKLPGGLGPHADQAGRGRAVKVLGRRHRTFLLRKSFWGDLATRIIAGGGPEHNRASGGKECREARAHFKVFGMTFPQSRGVGGSLTKEGIQRLEAEPGTLRAIAQHLGITSVRLWQIRRRLGLIS